MSKLATKFIAVLAVFLTLLSTLSAETLTLSAKFVNDNKNRATISVQFELDAHLSSAHSIQKGGNDGDIHMAGRAPEVQLPMVAEIMNAKLDGESASVKLMNGTSPGANVPITGVWRIWFEHPSTTAQTQGTSVPVPANANPDHVFEIHPITKFDGQDISDSSLVPIVDPKGGASYEAYAAKVAFPAYEKLKASISVSSTAVSITANKAEYNYTEFVLEPAGKVVHGDDGLFVLANVYDVNDAETPLTSGPRRMVFVENSEPAKQLVALPKGGRLHVMGIPRVSLAEVAAVSGTGATSMNLPYEMIVVAVFPESGSSHH